MNIHINSGTAAPIQRRSMLRMAALGVFASAGAGILTACGGGDDTMAATPRLASVDNFRDVAGVDDANVYRNVQGRALRRGVIYRSNALTPNDADLATLNTLGITTVYDLRTTEESKAKPDRLPQGAHLVSINIAGSNDASLPTLRTPAEAIKYMEDNERALAQDEGCRARTAQALTAFANTSGVQLFHCTGGKDRTGWVDALLLSIVGVDQAVIMKDYLLTNTYSKASIQATYDKMLAARGKDYADALYPLLGVQESFLAAGLDQAVKSYGSVAGYVSHGLGLSDAVQEKLRNKLLA